MITSTPDPRDGEPERQPGGKVDAEPEEKVHRAFCGLVLEASDADTDEIIRSLGKDPAELEKQAREAWTSALSENTDSPATTSKTLTMGEQKLTMEDF